MLSLPAIGATITGQWVTDHLANCASVFVVRSQSLTNRCVLIGCQYGTKPFDQADSVISINYNLGSSSVLPC